MNDCTTCKNHSPLMKLDDIPNVCFPCAYNESIGLGHTEYVADLGKCLSKRLEDTAKPPHKEVRIVSKGYPKEDNALDVQVGGDHYKSLAIQPVTYITQNNLGYCEANVVKYITRWRDKGGKKDLEKAKHYIDLLIEMEGL